MAAKQKNLVHLCKEFDLFEERLSMKKIEAEASSQFKSITQEALQWLEELKEQHKAITSEAKGPLLPQTPTMKRKLRKRKLPPVEDPEKENSAAVTRSRRAASQAANLKFREQLNIPLSKKMRRPSSPKAIGETTINSSLDVNKQNERQLRGQKRLRVRYEEVTDDEEEEEVPNASTVSVASTTTSRNRAPPNENDEATTEDFPSHKVSTASTSDIDAGKKTRAKKFKITDEMPDKIIELKPPSKTIKSHLRNQDKSLPSEDAREIQIVSPSPTGNKNSKKVDATTLISIDIKEERLSTVFEDNGETPYQINMARQLTIAVQRLSRRITSTVRVTPKGTLICLDEPETELAILNGDEVDMPVTATLHGVVEKEHSLRQTRSSEARNINKSIESKKEADKSANTGRQGDLLALTPHLKGIVKERVEAVEKSLKKDETNSKIIQNKEKQNKVPSVLKPIENSASEASSDAFESADDEEPSPTLSFAALAGAKTSTVVKTYGKKATVTSLKKHIRSPSTPARELKVKLFSEETLRKRSKSVDQNLSNIGKAPTSAQPRSRVLTGVRTFIKPSAKEQAATAAAEEEKKRKAEEVQRNLERVHDAARKKEEQLRLKKEQKKRENEEKRAKALLAQEARAREQEELAKIEKERLERKALQQRLREEKELAEKEARKELKKQRQAEREQRRKDEEAIRQAKAKEITLAAAQEQAKREEDRKADLAKGGWAVAPNAKVQTTVKTVIPHPTSKVTPVPASKPTHMNETFEIPTKPANTELKPIQPPAVTALASTTSVTITSNSYAMTPSKDEMLPLPPKNPNDYGVDEVAEDDPSDDDEKPKKRVPAWAKVLRANPSLECADYVSIGLRNRLFGTRVFKPSAQELFGATARNIQRRSSAIWNTPPNVHHISMCSSFLEGH